MFSNDNYNYLYNTMGNFYGQSIHNYVKGVLNIHETLSLKYLQAIRKEKLEEYLSLRFKLQWYIYSKKTIFEIETVFQKLKAIYTMDAEIYYTMAKKYYSHTEKEEITSFQNNYRDRNYFINKAYKNISRAMFIDKNQEYFPLYRKCKKENFSGFYKDEKITIIKRGGFIFGVILLLLLVFVNEVMFGDRKSLYCYNNFVIPFENTSYDYDIYGGLLNKQNALDILSKNNINSRDDALVIINYLQENKLSESFKNDFYKYKREKNEQLENQRENKDVEDKSEIDSEKSLIYKTFDYYIDKKNNSSIPDDAFEAFESLSGNYFTEISYRAGYISFKEALNFNEHFTKPLLRIYGDKDIKVSVQNAIKQEKTLKNSDINKYATIYLQRFCDNKLDNIKLNDSFDLDKFSNNYKNIRSNKIESNYKLENIFISEASVKYYILGLDLNIIASTIVVIATIGIYLAFIYFVNKIYCKKLENI